MDKRVLAGIIAVALVLGYWMFAPVSWGGGGMWPLEEPPIVTITKESPTIQLGDTQYHYGMVSSYEGTHVYSGFSEAYGCHRPYMTFEYTEGMTIENWIDLVTCKYAYMDTYADEGTRRDFATAVGKWAGHKIVVDFDVYTDTDACAGRYAEQDGVKQNACCSSGTCCINWFGSGDVKHIMIARPYAYYDAEQVEITQEFVQSPFGTGIDFPYVDVKWITINDIVVKLEALDEGGITRFNVWFYVPSTYFEQSTCGDGHCDLDETCKTCPQDCGLCPETCGDSICNETETWVTCPIDCPPPEPFCGDSFCNGDEDCGTCPVDCGSCITYYCGDGTCNGNETCASCIQDCGACPGVCGNGICDGGETCESCTQDCGVCAPRCGDGRCNGDEDCSTCSIDCGNCPPYCGDGVCGIDETCRICQIDCGPCPAYCGDGTCDYGETKINCPMDCGYSNAICGDGLCNGFEDCAKCPADCGVCPIIEPTTPYYDLPVKDEERYERYLYLVDRERTVGLDESEEVEFEELEDYVNAYIGMLAWFNGRLDVCYDNSGHVYNFLEYLCDGFPTEFVYSVEDYPEFDLFAGCCIAGFGPRRRGEPIVWVPGSGAPDFLRTKVPIEDWDDDYDLAFSKSCAEATNTEGFIYALASYSCENQIGWADQTGNYGCCLAGGEVCGDGTCSGTETPENCPEDCQVGGGGWLDLLMEYWYVFVIGGALFISIIGVILIQRKEGQ